jgi:hypothetical protein
MNNLIPKPDWTSRAAIMRQLARVASSDAIRHHHLRLARELEASEAVRR